MAAVPLIAGTTSGATTAVIEHPLYSYFAPIWRKLAHAVEGIAGFQDGTYLIAHPREYLDHDADNPTKPTKKLIERRKLARYENWPLTLLTLMTGALFRAAATRRAGDEQAAIPHPLAAWWQDVDGLGTSIDLYLQRAWMPAAVFGHVFLVLDRPAVQAVTAADSPSLYLRGYTPLDVPDWLTDDRGALSAVALKELVPRTEVGVLATDQEYVRLLTRDGYRLRGAETVLSRVGIPLTGPSAVPGQLPVVPLYARRRPLIPVIGQSVLGDPGLYIDDYNLTSEKRELLRKQTFSLINVPLGSGPDGQTVAEAQAMLGAATGTTNILFSALQAQILSPDTSNVDAYQSEQQDLRRSMFRASGLPWESDSKDAEAADSRKIKREDLNQTLALFAAELEAADLAIARLWMQATHGERWREEWDLAGVTIAYPRSFDADDLDTLIARAQAAVGLSLGPTVSVAVKKQVAAQLVPNQTAEQEAQIAKELEQEVAEAAEQAKAMRTAFAEGARVPAPDHDDETGDEASA